jgi:hypothetical protein
MISRDWLLDAMQGCETELISAPKREKLAQLYIIYDHLYGFQPNATKIKTEKQTIISTGGTSDFLKAVQGKESNAIWDIINELMASIKVIQPGLYDAVLIKIHNV